MAKKFALKTGAKEKIQPKAANLFAEFEEILKKHNLEGFSIKDFRLVHKEEVEDCPCGTESIILPSGRTGTRCKRCPPPPRH